MLQGLRATITLSYVGNISASFRGTGGRRRNWTSCEKCGILAPKQSRRRGDLKGIRKPKDVEHLDCARRKG